MTKGLLKNIIRTIKGSFGRYIAILLIILLGVGFFCGLRLTQPVMAKVQADYIERLSFYDVRLLSTYGFDDTDVENIKKTEGARDAEGSVSFDFCWFSGDAEIITKALMIPERINLVNLIAGRMPEKPEEILADGKKFKESDIGSVIKISEQNEEDTLDYFKCEEYTIVGICTSPLYMNVERGTTTLGRGSIDNFMYFRRDGLNFEYYTELYVKSVNDYIPYSDEADTDNENLCDSSKLVAESSVNKRYEDIVSEANDKIADAEETLEKESSEAKAELDDAKKKLDDAAKELADGEAELKDAKAELDDAKAEIDKGAKKLQSNFKSWSGAISYGRNEIKKGRNELSEKKKEGEAKLAKSKEALEKSEKDYEEKYKQYQMAVSMVEAGLISEEASGIAAAKAGLDTYRSELDKGWEQYNQGVKTLESEVAAATKKLNAADKQIDKFEAGIKDYNEGLKKYNDGVKELEDGRLEYEDGLREYEDGLKEYEDKINDAKKEIDDAKKEVAELEDPELYAFGRSYNAGFASFESDSLIVDKVAKVFPVFFFMIAALICSTTMTRMIDDERGQIGILRALGYSSRAIMTKYLIYSGSAAIIGALVGYFGGGFLFPKVIWIAYQMLYNIPGYTTIYNIPLLIIALLVSLLCSVGTTYLAVRSDMKREAADLVRPRAPQAGKRIFLERLPFFWNRLKFLHKVTLRNIFRFKKRMFMMIIGISGCTALVLTGFGIRDSVADLAEYQYNEILKYDLLVTCKEKIDDTVLSEIEETLDQSDENLARTMMTSGNIANINTKDTTKDIYFVISDDAELSDIIILKNIDNKKQVLAYPGQNEAVITDKAAKILGIKVGDTAVIGISDTEKAEVKITGIAENYVQSYVYMTGDTYTYLFGKEYEPKTLVVSLKPDMDEYKIGANIADLDEVGSVTVVTDIKNRIGNMMQSLNYVIILVIGSAGALAFIVLFNLGNINISERVREIATIKVLGFHRGETGAYVFRENIILSIMGIIVGLPLGILFHAFVMDQIQVDMVSFMTEINKYSYIYTVVTVILFAVITDIIMRRKIAKIEMAESLKSVE